MARAVNNKFFETRDYSILQEKLSNYENQDTENE